MAIKIKSAKIMSFSALNKTAPVKERFNFRENNEQT